MPRNPGRRVVSDSEMSAAARPLPLYGLPALGVSLLLHGSLVAVPVLVGLHVWTPPQPPRLENESVALVGNSIEVDAPTPELAAPPAAQEQEVAVETAAEAEADEPRPKVETETETEKPRPKAETETKPKPVKPRAKPLASVSAAAASSAASGSSEAQPASTPAPGSFGAEGLPPGVRRLGYAFARAIPVYTPAAAEWCQMPVGPVGRIVVELTIDASNHVTGMQTGKARPSEAEPPAALKQMVERTLMSLKVGEFALSGSNDPGSERLTIEVSLRDAAPDDTGQCLVVEKGFHGATPGNPGEAHFRFGTGRVFDAKVTIAPRD